VSWNVQEYPTRALVSCLSPVDKVERWHLELASRMFEIIEHGDRRGVGLAANQVGAEVCMFVWLVNGEGDIVFNPEIIDRSSRTSVMQEGCLSLPASFLVNVQRPDWIVVRWMDRGGVVHEDRIGEGGKWDSFTARVWHHEIDHLNGLSIVDTMSGSSKRKKRTQLASIMERRRLLDQDDPK